VRKSWEAVCPALVRFTFSIDVLYESLIFVFEIGQGTGGQSGGGGLMNEVEKFAGGGGGGGSGGMMNEVEKFAGGGAGGGGGGGMMNELEKVVDGGAGGGFF